MQKELGRKERPAGGTAGTQSIRRTGQAWLTQGTFTENNLAQQNSSHSLHSFTASLIQDLPCGGLQYLSKLMQYTASDPL